MRHYFFYFFLINNAHFVLVKDAVSVRVPENPGEEGELTVLGHVTHRLVLAPDWDSLLQKSGLNQSLAWTNRSRRTEAKNNLKDKPGDLFSSWLSDNKSLLLLPY